MFNIVVCLVGFSALSERNDYHGLSLAGVWLLRLTHYKSVDETNIRIRPRKRKEMGLTYFIDLECMYWMGEED